MTEFTVEKDTAAALVMGIRGAKDTYGVKKGMQCGNSPEYQILKIFSNPFNPGSNPKSPKTKRERPVGHSLLRC
jgi:hypothetical protein